MTTDAIIIGGGIGKVKINSPFVIARTTMVLSIIGTLITTVLAGTAIIRDFQFKAHEIFFTKPISKTDYIGGRFVGVTFVMILAYMGITTGLFLGELMPWIDADKLGPFNGMAYINSFLIFLLPNVIFMSALFFAVGTLTRNLFLVYVQGIVLLIAQTIAQTITADLDNEWISNLLDPFGGQAFSLTTKYWTVAEQNGLQLSFLSEFILPNRLLWISISAVLFAVTFVLFKFDVQPLGQRKKRRKPIPVEVEEKITFKSLELPRVAVKFDLSAQFSQFISLVRFYVKGIITDVPYLAIAAIGILNFVAGASFYDTIFGTTTWPVTYIMIEALSGFTLFAIIISTVYAGELINKERGLNLAQTFDSLNLPNHVVLLAKFTSLVAILGLLFLMLIPVAMGIQVYKGYYNFELGIYLSDFLINQMVSIVSLAFIVFLVHTLINNKFLGHFLVVLHYVLLIAINELGFEHNLFSYGSSVGATYSDMNGWGPFLTPKFWWELHWYFVGGFFLVLSSLFWVRGTEEGFVQRLKLIPNRFQGGTRMLGGFFLVAMLISGTWITYNTTVVNDFRNSDDSEKIRAEFEKSFKQYEELKIPKIIDSYIEFDIYPDDAKFHVKGRNLMVNKTDAPIDSMWLNWDKNYEYAELTFDAPHREVKRNELYEFSIIALESPLMPGDSLTISFDFTFQPKGFRNSGASTTVVENGTFINNDVFPSLGYNSGVELSSDETRKENGLEPKDRLPKLEDSTAYNVHALGGSADWVDFETIVSTKKGQTAIAPGYLVKQWDEGDRAYFHYKMDAPILYFFSFLSGDFDVAEDSWNDVAIQIYHHAGHKYNIDRMIKSLKDSFDYFTEAFGPYQFRQIRILEFPRYASFAQSFPNTVPFSEAIGFIARLKEATDVDYPYYITSHELAHQWFGHQIVGANVQGSTMLIESFAQYGALMAMKKEYGEDLMKKFLKYELDSYLNSRSGEQKKELPLMRVENQQYIHYRKGSIVMYAMQDFLGEELFNSVIRGFINDNKFQDAPYTTSMEFVNRLREATPDSMKYLVEDMFETITLYENRAMSGTYTMLPDSTWEVSLAFESKKMRADSLGFETDITFNDYIEIGVFGDLGKEFGELGERLYLKKHKISGSDTVRIVVDKKPTRAGIDPYNKLIDRNSDDNTKRLEEKEE